MLIQGGAPTVSFNMSDDDVAAFMRQPWTMTSTDGGLPEFGKSSEHPRAYGAFPRKLRRYVLDHKVIDMPHAIQAGTGLTAQIFPSPERGKLPAGEFADVIVFDSTTVRAVAHYEPQHTISVGMASVIMNGKAAIANGKTAPAR